MTGPWQIGLIILVVILLFGAKRIPEVMGSLGKGIKEFKKAGKDEEEEEEIKDGEKKKGELEK